jgi:hypothetical protein
MDALGWKGTTVKQLANRSGTRDKLLAVIEKLAAAIKKAVRAGGMPRHPRLEDLRLVPSAFEPIPPRLITWLVASRDWATLMLGDVPASAVVADVASILRSPCVLTDLRSLSQVTTGSAIVLADSMSPLSSELKRWAAGPHEDLSSGLLLLVPTLPQPGMEKAVLETWAASLPDGGLKRGLAMGHHALVPLSDRLAFRNALEKLWSALEVQMLRGAVRAKAVSRPLEDAAAARGVNLESVPRVEASAT